MCLPHCAGAEHCSDQKCETLRKMHSIMPRSRSHGRVDASQASQPPWDGISTIKCKLLGEKLRGKLALHIESGAGTRERQLLWKGTRAHHRMRWRVGRFRWPMEEATGVVRMWHANSSDDASFCSVGSADVAFHLGFRHCGWILWSALIFKAATCLDQWNFFWRQSEGGTDSGWCISGGNRCHSLGKRLCRQKKFTGLDITLLLLFSVNHNIRILQDYIGGI